MGGFSFLRTTTNDEWRVRFAKIRVEMQIAELHQFYKTRISC